MRALLEDIGGTEPNRDAVLRAELASARLHMVSTGSRLRMLLQSPDATLCEIAEAADAVSLQAGRLAGFARLLTRST